MNSHIEPDVESTDMNTLEIAGLYERQGYYEDAHRIYAALDAVESTPETKEGLDRTQEYALRPDEKISARDIEGDSGEKKVRILLEEWCALLAARHRLDTCKALRSRIV